MQRINLVKCNPACGRAVGLELGWNSKLRHPCGEFRVILLQVNSKHLKQNILTVVYKILRKYIMCYFSTARSEYKTRNDHIAASYAFLGSRRSQDTEVFFCIYVLQHFGVSLITRPFIQINSAHYNNF